MPGPRGGLRRRPRSWQDWSDLVHVAAQADALGSVQLASQMLWLRSGRAGVRVWVPLTRHIIKCVHAGRCV